MRGDLSIYAGLCQRECVTTRCAISVASSSIKLPSALPACNSSSPWSKHLDCFKLVRALASAPVWACLQVDSSCTLLLAISAIAARYRLHRPSARRTAKVCYRQHRTGSHFYLGVEWFWHMNAFGLSALRMAGLLISSSLLKNTRDLHITVRISAT